MMDDEAKHILVTGGAGYIGSTLIRLLLERGYKVRCLDNLTFGGEALIDFKLEADFEFYMGDITDPEAVEEALEDIDAVVHLAAIVGDPACRKYPDKATRINRDGAKLLIDKAVEEKIERFIFASTCSNYGQMPDPEGYVDETAELHPVSLYAELKVEIENYLLNLNEDMTAVCLRFSTAYGLSERMRFDLTVNEFTRDLATSTKLEIFGEQFWRPYCHIVDLSQAIIKTLEAPREIVHQQAFNVGGDHQNFQKKGIVELILKQLPEKHELVSYVHKEEDPRDYRVKFDKIKNALDFKLSCSVEDGITEIIHAINSGHFSDPFDIKYSNLYMNEDQNV